MVKAKQSLLWTALPNGYSQNGRSLRISVLLSPRLDAGDDPEELSTFDDFIDWPATLAEAEFTISYGPDKVTIGGEVSSGPNRIDDSVGTPDSDVWRALFPESTFVEGYRFRDLSDHAVLSFPAANIDTLVRGLYSRLAASAQEELPPVSEILEDPEWGNVLNVIARNDEAFMDHRAGLRDPAKQFEAFRKGEIKKSAPLIRDLALFQLFHTPPAKPKRQKYEGVDPKDARARAEWLSYERTELPKPTDFKKTIDFHQIVAAMNQYPTLLRKCGLVIDLLVSRNAFTHAANQPLHVKVKLPDTQSAVTREPDVSPRTRTLLDGSKFQAVPRPASGAGEYKINDGLLDLDPKVFSLLQSDVDGAGTKLMGFARSLLILRNSPDTQVDPTTKHERGTGAPALRNAGLMLVHGRRAEMLEKSFARQKQFNEAAEKIQANMNQAPPSLFAEDLVRGFRIDIWDDVTKQWHSLCKRASEFDIAEGEILISVPEEEGTVRLAATTPADKSSNQKLVWLHEALVSWTGWSLCAPAPGRSISHDNDDHTDPVTDGEVEVPPGLPLRTSFKALPGSLPRLRYGRRYWIRARIVDLASNSLELQDKDFGPEKSKTNARAYLRYEPISAPAIALVKPAPQSVEEPGPGESMERLAIRTFNDTPADNTIPADEIARRFAVPARTSQREAEHHGAFDRNGKVDASFFSTIATKDNSLAEEKLMTAGPLSEDPPVETGFAVMVDGDELPYLPDPLAVEIAARVFDHPDFPPNLIRIPLYPGAAEWPNAAPFKIKLLEEPGAQPRFDSPSRTLLVPLPKAERAKLRLSVKPSREALELLGVWQWLTPAQQSNMERLAREGQHWMLTPWRTLELVHAVQKPLITPDVAKLSIDRPLHSTSAIPHFVAACSIKSTDHIDVLAEWNEPNIDLAAGAGENRARKDHAFAVKITDDKSYRGPHEYRREGPNVIRLGGLFDDRIGKRVHEFNDTRYRRIEYWLEATSKFREFMPSALLTETVAGEIKATDKNIKVEGKRITNWIPNSAPPPAPEVISVVPTFGWVRSSDQRIQQSWRRGGGLRVYLNRPWNVSGYGEMLAVVLPSASFTGDPNTSPAAQPLKNFVTQWGNDPIWLSPFLNGSSPKRSNFPLARNGPDAAGKWLPGFAPLSEADQPQQAFIVTGLPHPELRTGGAQSRVEIAPHDVFFDEERRLWYCDIEVNWGTSYYPFIRLALARYQPVSVSGAHLSNIVLADFMPLVPDRWLNVTQTIEPRTRHVTVFGFTYENSSGHQESRGPRRVAASSVVEVWVESFDPALGEDFGWRRDPNAFVQRNVKIKLAGLEVTSKAAVAREKSRAKTLLKHREYASLVEENLLEHVFITPRLWEGSVTLPQERSKRYRLVVAEYEEYLVDDDRPYDQNPTAKDRRLVFVEHVELT